MVMLVLVMIIEPINVELGMECHGHASLGDDHWTN